MLDLTYLMQNTLEITLIFNVDITWKPINSLKIKGLLSCFMASELISPMFITERAENSQFRKGLFILDLNEHNCKQVQISSFQSHVSTETLFFPL